MFVSDLHQDVVTGVRSRSWREFLRVSLTRIPKIVPPRPPTKRQLAYGLLAASGLYVTLYAVATLFAAPLVAPSAASPEFPIEITSSGDGPVTVLAHGREVGWHLLRVPSASSGNAGAVIPANLADSELRLISLGWSSLTLRSLGPFGTTTALGAQGRSLTIYRTPERTGVRAW
jgi:hypothetical protein